MTKNDTPANIRLNKRQRNKYLGVKSEVCGCVFDVLYVLIQRLKINKEKTEPFRVLWTLRYESKLLQD